ncbi:aminopeptidase P family protein [Amycolatopsis acidicola]|uniref:Aminopeptidase P family protein n=1 Tax=Amycolatopsis acidicola TaxID=2596893 RepID=A0A5N0V063_9PSEU|nr:M24 family metallopeptidase [Amycolatopsis acidicola]KAA9159592.1 aminopeptidase P family protein [Amycolatopsis acidicola]
MATENLPDDRALRSGRRDRALAQMEAHDLDVLVLGRTANVRYVTGAKLLWLAGTQPFGPACVLVRSTRAIHLLSTWDDGVPEDIPRENLFGLTWNPMNTITVLRGIEGAAGAKRVGTDALSPTFAQLLPMAFPAAELADGEIAMREARRIKTGEELDAIAESVAVAETSLAKAVAELRPGVGEKQLDGILLEAAAAGGITTPAVQDAVWITSREHQWRRVDSDRTVEAGDLVAFTAGVVGHGYIGEVGRTHPVGGRISEAAAALYARNDALWQRLLAVCKPGVSPAKLLDAYEEAGEPLPPMAVARGLGLGFDPPVVTAGLPATAAAERLEAHSVLALTAYVWEPGVGAVFRRDTVALTEDGPRVLSSGAPVPGA